MGFEVKVTWLEEFIEKIDDKGDVRKALNTGLKKVVFFLEGEAKVFTPVDTWILRNSFRQKYGNLTAKLFNIRNYWIFVHEGTRFIKSNPFLTKTVKKAWKEIELIMNEEIQDALKILK